MSSPERTPAVSRDSLDARTVSLVHEIEEELTAGTAKLSSAAVQGLAAALCRAYAAGQEAGESFPILARQDAVTGTDVMIVCSALLKAADLQVFELGMWSSWTGR
jgi:hypothetical protein